MEFESSLPGLQEPITGSCPEIVELYLLECLLGLWGAMNMAAKRNNHCLYREANCG